MSLNKENLLFHFVEKWAEIQPESESLVFQEERLTWKDFKEKTDLIAKAFISAGVEKGDKVCMLSMARNEFMTTFMAASKSGAVWLGLNPKSSLDELKYIIGHCKPKVLISLRNYYDIDLTETIKELLKEFSFLKTVLVIGEKLEGTNDFHEYTEELRPELDSILASRASELVPENDVLLMYTSGSTGKPKGVIHTHNSIIKNIEAESRAFKTKGSTRGLLHFPINHVAADVEIGFAVVFDGGCLINMDSFDPVESLKIIEKEKITLLGQVPVMYLLQMQMPNFKDTDFSSVKLFAWAGAAAPAILTDALMAICKETGAKVMTGYGSTEVAGFVTYTNENDDPEIISKSVGKIAPPFEVKIVDKERNSLNSGETGEIAVKGDFLFREYLNNEEETEKAIDADGWYYTDDFGYMDEAGNIFLAGRKSEMYKSGGENVFPREIEEVLESHPGVLFAAVIGAKDDLYQEVGWAFIMLTPGKEATEEELTALCKEKLSNFKVPKRYFIRPLLPLLANGKVNKLELKEEMKTL